MLGQSLKMWHGLIFESDCQNSNKTVKIHNMIGVLLEKLMHTFFFLFQRSMFCCDI
jgi:hypothetical protein